MKIQGITLEELEELLPAVIFGAEGEEGEGQSEDSDDDAGDEDEDAGSDSDNDDDSEHDDANDPKVKGLKAALAAERKKNAALDKKLKAETKAKEAKDLAEKSDIEQAQIREQKANERAEKLSNGFLQRSLNDAIRRAAEKAKFIDPSDAIEGVDRTGLAYEQDPDDPSEVEIDEKTITAAVKALATKKPHFLKSGTDDGEPTGGQFGGSRKKKSTTEDELKNKYPALRNS